MSPATSPSSSNKDRPKGELFVWITGLGLAIGLAMVVFLLYIIASNGIAEFWPKAIAAVKLSAERDSRFRGGETFAGILTETKAIDVRDLSAAQLESSNPKDRLESQFFVGNRDAYGFSFIYFPEGDILSVDYPRDLIFAERMEWGNAIFYPLALRLGDGTSIK